MRSRLCFRGAGPRRGPAGDAWGLPAAQTQCVMGLAAPQPSVSQCHIPLLQPKVRTGTKDTLSPPQSQTRPQWPPGRRDRRGTEVPTAPRSCLQASPHGPAPRWLRARTKGGRGLQRSLAVVPGARLQRCCVSSLPPGRRVGARAGPTPPPAALPGLLLHHPPQPAPSTARGKPHLSQVAIGRPFGVCPPLIPRAGQSPVWGQEGWRAACAGATSRSLQGMRQTWLFQHLLTCSPLHTHRATVGIAGNQGQGAEGSSSAHRWGQDVLVYGLWPSLTSIRSRQRRGCSSLQHGGLGRPAWPQRRHDAKARCGELVPIVLGEHRKADRPG